MGSHLRGRWARRLALVFAAILLIGVFPTGGMTAGQHEVAWETISRQDLPPEVARWADAYYEQQGVQLLPAGAARYLLVAWGEKPTGGYQLVVEDVQRDDANLLRVSVALSEPDPDEAVIQVLTYPYRLVKLPPGDETILVNFHGARWHQDALGDPDDSGPPILLEARNFPDGSTPNPLVLRGTARVFEATMQLVVEDGHYQLRNHWLTLAAGGPDWAEFEVAVTYPDPSNPAGMAIGAYEDAADGRLVEVAFAPLVFTTVSNRLADVDGHWAEASIRQGVWERFIAGYPDGAFLPELEVTRAEFLKMLVAAVTGDDVPGEAVDQPFTDIENHWARDYVTWAAAAGWISTAEDGEAFEPDAVVSRQVMARWAARAASVDEGDPADVNFTDREAIAAAYMPWVAAAVDVGLLQGYPDGTFRPAAGLKRSEAVTVVLRALDHGED